MSSPRREPRRVLDDPNAAPGMSKYLLAASQPQPMPSAARERVGGLLSAALPMSTRPTATWWSLAAATMTVTAAAALLVVARVSPKAQLPL